MKTVEIPGGIVSLREANEIRQRDRKRVVSASLAAASAMSKIEKMQLDREELQSADIASLGLTFEEAESFQTLQKAMIVACVIGWTLDLPIPTWETAEDLPSNVYSALEQATKDDLMIVLQGTDFEASDPRAPGFEESPTGPSGGSAAGSRAEQESGSISTQESGGSSTDTGQSSPA